MLKCFALVCILGLTVSAFEWDSAAQTGKKSQRMNLLSRTVGARMLAGTNGQMDSTFQTMNPATGTNQQFVPIARQSNAAINSMTQTPTQTGGQVMDNSLTGGQQLTPDQLQQLQQFLSAQTQSQQQTGVQRQMTTQQTATPQQQPTQTFRMDTTGMTGSTGMTGTTMDGVSADQQQRMTGGQFGGQIPTTGGRMMPSTTPVTPMVVSTPMTVMNQASKPSALEQQLLDQQILTQKLKEQLQQLQQQQQGRTFQQQQPVDTTGFGQTQTPQQTGRFQQTTDQTTGFGQTQTQTPQQTGRFQQTTDQTTGFGQTQTQTPQQTGRFQQTTDQTGFGQTQTPTTLTADQQVQRMTAQQQQKQQQQLLDQINQLNQMNQARTVATPVGTPVVGMQQPTKMTPPTQTFMPTTNTSRMVTSQGMRPPTTGPMMTTTTGGFAGKSTARMGGDICASAKPGELLPHPLDETQFLVCNELGEITLMDCPNHTVFNPHLKLCDLTTDMPILCKSNPCLNGAKCVDVSPIEFRCECPQGFSGKTCEKFDTCSTSRPCGNDGVCLSFALGSPIPHVCLCNGGRSVGLMCDKGEQNPCTMPGSSTKLMPVNFNRAVFAHCEGARPHFKFCQPPLMFSASKQACEWSV